MKLLLFWLCCCLPVVMRRIRAFPTQFHPLEFSSSSTTTTPGIMSMVQLPHESIPQLVAGTKRNDLLWIQFHRIPDSMQVQTSCLFTSRDDDNDDAYKKAKLQLPIYSLAFDPTTQTLFVGSGDRYVSLWNNNNNNNKHRWQQLETKLGPHTGWVKDITILGNPCKNNNRLRLFSIGCNRIEIWSRDMKGDSPPPNNEAWVHADTLFVESSTKKSDACTLSSDLLCLEICTCTVTQCHDKRSNTATTTTTTTTTMEILAAGGVDGRIHFFEIPKERTEPIQRIYSIAAHDGRVNSLCWDPIDSFLYSIGHDGCVCCWSIDKHHDQSEDNLYQQQIRVRVVTKLSIANERITAIAIGNSICNSTTNNHLAVGTHNGSIYFLSLQHIDNNWELGCIRKHAIECYEGCPIITSLCMLHVPGRPNDDVSSICVLVVGHSLGMGYITV